MTVRETGAKHSFQKKPAPISGTRRVSFMHALYHIFCNQFLESE